jgi:hypothetical protein
VALARASARYQLGDAMPQGSSKTRKGGKLTRGGRESQKQISKMRKGSLICKPKRAQVAAKLNQSQRITGAITRNIEKEMGQKVQTNGGSLSLLKGVANSSKVGDGKPRKAGKPGSVKAEQRTSGIEERSGEPSRCETAPKFNPKKRFKL